jgi:hypothetical protein
MNEVHSTQIALNTVRNNRKKTEISEKQGIKSMKMESNWTGDTNCIMNYPLCCA